MRTPASSRARRRVAGLDVDPVLFRFVEDELLPGSGVDAAAMWAGLSDLVDRFGPRNRALLATRDRLQAAIDAWHDQHPWPVDDAAYRAMLTDLGYLRDAGPPFDIDTAAVDPEIGSIPGPQLVVPVLNARYALNAANARWGSLYDALYGTDALGSPPPGGPYDAERGRRVIEWARAFLDEAVPLVGASHRDARRYSVQHGEAEVQLLDGRTTGLAHREQLVGFLGDHSAPTTLVLRNHGLGIELVIDGAHPIGATDHAHIADVRLEAAVTAIMDCEDSVAAVDATDKVGVYRNWLGLMKGDLVEQVTKDGTTFVRRLAADRELLAPDGSTTVQRARALMLVRNVGILMTTPAVLDRDGNEIFEGLLDGVITVLAAKHDLDRGAAALNSRTGSVYVVKPKLHGPDEAAYVDDVFAAVESMLDLPQHTVKVGLMDEERRTSANLLECIRAVRHRIAFINTGFLDRTGDEIHTSMHAGAMVRKADMRSQPWIDAYEIANVDTGLACGFRGRAQIGKGMWAAPDRMREMLETKDGHPRAGASCAWVPSPTAATLHATHYHRVDVAAVQDELAQGGPRSSLERLLQLPVDDERAWTPEEIQAELDNNAQGILGYVVRWIDQGVGCSKVPDINDVGLMEDRATCRISSQHITNWMAHSVVSRAQVEDTFRRMAAIVDAQNEHDPGYTPMAPACDGIAFRAALDLVLDGAAQPNGYTEPILHRRRVERKRHDI